MRVVIMRGLPGSGKSSLARSLAAHSPAPSVILSTDDWFVVAGTYRFDAAALPAAHAWNQWRFGQALKMRIPLIIVDNTNVRHEHMRPYIDAARLAGYAVEKVFVGTSASNEELARRNTHGVPVEVIAAMRDGFEILETEGE